MTFPRFNIEQSDTEFYTSQSGVALVGLAINKFTSLNSRVAKAAPCKGVATADVLRCYLGLLCQGKSDFEAIRPFFEDDAFFAAALGVNKVPSPETLRQRMDAVAEATMRIVDFCTVEFLKKAKAEFSKLETGHMPLDLDVFTQDNSNTKKEGASWTYRKFHGFAPIAAWLGLEGWCLEIEHRPGSQHAQEGFVPFLLRAIYKSRQLTEAPLLVRLDSAHDAMATLVALKEEKVDFIVKWNPRGTDVPARASEVFAHGKMIKQDKKGRIAIMTETVERSFKDEEGKDQTLKVRRVLRATERYFEKDGTPLLVPDIEIEGWWTSLSVAKDKVIELYKGHALCEQYHSELKSDMDLERLPSGKFATNTLVMHCAGLAYNILRAVGQVGLMTGKQRRRAKQRRRLKTVIQDLVYFAGRFIRHAHTLTLRFSRHAHDQYDAFSRTYRRFAYG
ncbi:MAG: IS1380 family transposase [bacterium]